MLLVLDVAPTQTNQHILKETLSGHQAVVSVDRVPQHGKYPNNSSPSVSEGKLLTVGMIGFPNVGKSTLVDALLGRKQVFFSFFLPHQVPARPWATEADYTAGSSSPDGKTSLGLVLGLCVQSLQRPPQVLCWDCVYRVSSS